MEIDEMYYQPNEEVSKTEDTTVEETAQENIEEPQEQPQIPGVPEGDASEPSPIIVQDEAPLEEE